MGKKAFSVQCSYYFFKGELRCMIKCRVFGVLEYQCIPTERIQEWQQNGGEDLS